MSFESEVLSRLDRIEARQLGVQPNALPATPVVGKMPAYDRPQLLVEQVLYFDGKTINPDGSIWGMQTSGFSPSPDLAVKGPVCIAYGYISPVKTPEIWHLGRKWNGNWDYWVSSVWARNPYMIVVPDIPKWIRDNTDPALGEPQNNFILLNYMLNSSRSFVQE